MSKTNRRGFLKFLGAGAAGAGAVAAAGSAQAQAVPEQSEYPVGSIRWAQQQIVAGHRVRQRCWKDGAGCENPRDIVEVFGSRYEKGIDSTQGLPVFIELLHGLDWEIVP